MTTLVVGASGATGRLVVQQLLDQGEHVKIIVRSVIHLNEVFSTEVIEDKRLTITEANIMDLSAEELKIQVKNCRAVISCLGHNLTFKGMFSEPRRLVTNTVERLCTAIQNESVTSSPVKFILMNTTGNQNKVDGEQVSIMQSIVVKLIRLILPPHADNEDAAEYLQTTLRHKRIEWVVVRPDSLIDEASVSLYDIHASPIRSAIFDAGKTSRINVANFMSTLVVNENTWRTWQKKMPVIYNEHA